MMITKATIYELDFIGTGEREGMEVTREIAKDLIHFMEENGIETIGKVSTGEVIGLDDLYRLRGILGGLLDGENIWEEVY